MLLWSLAAFAQDTSPARLCADAAEGTAVEVCLRLAAEYPDRIDEIAAALRGRVDRQRTPDRELLEALLLLLSEETSEAGAQRLGQLDDSRAVAPLAHAATAGTESVAIAAIRAFGSYPQGIPYVQAVLEDTRIDDTVRRAAIDTLCQMGTAAAADALTRSLRRSHLSPRLREYAIDSLTTTWPDRAEGASVNTSTRGAGWLSLAGAVGLGTALGASGAVGRAENLEWVGLASGTIAGATTGYLAGRAWPMEADEAAFIAAAEVTGVSAGGLIATGLFPETDNAAWLGATVGATTGLTGGLVFHSFWRGTERDLSDVLFLGATASATSAFTASLVNPTAQRPELAAGIGLAAGAVTGLAVGPATEIRGSDRGVILLSAAYGAALGGLLPLRGSQRSAATAASLGAGALVGYGIAQPLQTEWSTIAGGASGMTIGAVFGTGLGLALSPDQPMLIRASTLGGVGLGTAVGLALTSADPDPLDDRDVVLTSLTSGWLMWQSFALVQVVAPDDPRRGHGVALMIPSAAAATLAGVSRHIDTPIPNTMAATSLGLWGGYVGVTSGILAGASARDSLLTTIIVSDVALLTGSVLVSPMVQTPPLVIGIADAGGVVAGSVATLTASLATDNPKEILGASLAGATLGFAGGALAGSFVHRNGDARHIAWKPTLPHAPRLNVSPAALSDGVTVHYGVRVELSQW